MTNYNSTRGQAEVVVFTPFITRNGITNMTIERGQVVYVNFPISFNQKRKELRKKRKKFLIYF